jgi:hypothetical protein
VGSLGSVNTTESDPTISCEEGDCHDAGSVQSLSAANGSPGKSGRKQIREADYGMGSFGSRSATGNGSIIWLAVRVRLWREYPSSYGMGSFGSRSANGNGSIIPSTSRTGTLPDGTGKKLKRPAGLAELF